MRCLRLAVAVLAGVLVALSSSIRVEATPCWRAPVAGKVVDPFRAPPCPYCAGNRGLEYRVGSDAVVRAVATGTVSWAGTVAGTRYVVVRHANGWRATYGKLDSSGLSTGDRVVARSRIGSASGAFFFGLRLGDDYFDPAPYLGTTVGRPRLVPADGTAARPAPPPRLRCGS